MPLSLYSWNINGIRAAISSGALHTFVEQHNPDILCLQEIRAHEDQTETDLPQYIEFWNSGIKSSYSGTAILTRRDPIRVVNNLPEAIAERFDLTHDAFGHPNDEARVLAAEYGDFWLVNVYSPNAKPDLSRVPLRHNKWDPALLAYCQELEKQKPVVLCGDLNVAHTELDLAHPDSHRGKHGFTNEEREGIQNFLNAGFVDTFRMFTQGNGHYTWWSNFSNARALNLGWRIDYFLVSSSLKDKVMASQIHADIKGSDHCPISLTLDF